MHGLFALNRAEAFLRDAILVGEHRHDVVLQRIGQADAAAEIAQVMAQQISLADKVHLLNAFAAAHFMAGAAEYAAAREELEQALQLDIASAETLRNLAVLAKCQGEAEKAWAFAAKLPTSDFLLMAFLGK